MSPWMETMKKTTYGNSTSSSRCSFCPCVMLHSMIVAIVTLLSSPLHLTIHIAPPTVCCVKEQPGRGVESICHRVQLIYAQNEMNEDQHGCCTPAGRSCHSMHRRANKWSICLTRAHDFDCCPLLTPLQRLPQCITPHGTSTFARKPLPLLSVHIGQ